MAQYDVTALSSALEFDTTDGLTMSIVKISGADRVAVAWKRSATVWNVQCFSVNTTSGAISAIGSAVDFEAGTANDTNHGVQLISIDASNLFVAWGSEGQKLRTRLISVDGSGNCSTNGSAVEIGTARSAYPQAQLMDSTHVFLAWQDLISGGDQANSQVVSFNTGTGTITAIGTAHNFSGAGTGFQYTSSVLLSSSKVLLTYKSASNDGFAVVLSINTSTWAVTDAGSEFEFKDAITLQGSSVILMTDSAPDVVVIGWIDSVSQTVKLRSFNVDNSTWAITAKGAEFALATISENADDGISLQAIDSTHFIAFYAGSGADGYAGSFTLDGSSGDISATTTATEFETSQFTKSTNVAFPAKAGFFVCAWSGVGTDGFIRAFQVSLNTAYTITADAGAFTLTSVASNLKRGIKLIASLGTFALTGVSAITSFGRKMLASLGTFTLTGINATLLYGKLLSAATGAFVLTGVNATITSTRKIVAALGTFTLTGINSILFIGHTIIAATGAFVLTGINATITSARIITATLGQFVLTGVNVAFPRASKIFAPAGLFILSGANVAFSGARKIVAAVGTFTLTGVAALFPRASKIFALTGAFTLTGISARGLLNGVSILWTAASKSAVSTMANISKNAATWVNKLKS